MATRTATKWPRAALTTLLLAGLVACGSLDQPELEAGEMPGEDETPAQPRAAIQPQNFDDVPSLLERVASGEIVRVIARVAASFQPEGYLTAEQVSEQRLAIRTVQSAVLDQLPPEGHDAVRVFVTVPHLAMNVNEAGLNALLADAAVAGIFEDRSYETTLAQSTPLIGATEVWLPDWPDGADGEGWAVAILDTGVETGHAFFGGRVVAEACFSTTSPGFLTACPDGSDPEGADKQIGAGAAAPCGVIGCGHGTHVAGIASGAGAAFSGVAPASNLIAVQVFSSIVSDPPCTNRCPRTFESHYMKGLEFVHLLSRGEVEEYPDLELRIAAANMSLGGGAHSTACDERPAKDSIDNLLSLEIATIVASGNDSLPSEIGHPGCISTAITVGSTDDGSFGTIADEVSDFSNSSDQLELLAPGRWINSSIPGGVFADFSGTSMAAPHVAGAWAVIKQANPDWSVAEVLSRLEETGVEVTDNRPGAGGRVRPRIQLDRAILPAPLVWSQPAGAAVEGSLSSYFAPNDAGYYTAADFRLNEPTLMRHILAVGLDVTGELVNQSEISWYVYPDDNGAPAGTPEDGLDLHLWSYRGWPGQPNITILGSDIGLSLASTGFQRLFLPAGRYWLTVAPIYSSAYSPSPASPSWAWRSAAQREGPMNVISPSLLNVPEWTESRFAGSGLSDVAFRLMGEPLGHDLATTTVTASPGALFANGTSTSTITVTLKTDQGEDLGAVNATVDLETSFGSLGGVTDQRDGNYTATLTSIKATDDLFRIAQLFATVDGEAVEDSASVILIPPSAVPVVELKTGPGLLLFPDPGQEDLVVISLDMLAPQQFDTSLVELVLRLRDEFPRPIPDPVGASGIRSAQLYLDPSGSGELTPGATLLAKTTSFDGDGLASFRFDNPLLLDSVDPATLLVALTIRESQSEFSHVLVLGMLLGAAPLLLARGRRHARRAALVVCLCLWLSSCSEFGPGGPRDYGYTAVLETAIVSVEEIEVSVDELGVEGAELRFTLP